MRIGDTSRLIRFDRVNLVDSHHHRVVSVLQQDVPRRGYSRLRHLCESAQSDMSQLLPDFLPAVNLARWVASAKSGRKPSPIILPPHAQNSRRQRQLGSPTQNGCCLAHSLDSLRDSSPHVHRVSISGTCLPSNSLPAIVRTTWRHEDLVDPIDTLHVVGLEKRSCRSAAERAPLASTPRGKVSGKG